MDLSLTTLRSSSLPYFNMVLVGEKNVGKRSIFQRLKDNTFDEGTADGDGANAEYCHSTRTLDNGESVNLRVRNVAGMDRYGEVTQSYFDGVDAVVFVYSLDQPSSLTRLNFALDEACASSADSTMFVFFCNKIDLPADDRKLSTSEIEAFFDRQERGTRYENRTVLKYQLSAKTGQGVQEAITDVLKKSRNSEGDEDSLTRSSRQRMDDDVIRLINDGRRRRSKICCC